MLIRHWQSLPLFNYILVHIFIYWWIIYYVVEEKEQIYCKITILENKYTRANLWPRIYDIVIKMNFLWVQGINVLINDTFVKNTIFITKMSRDNTLYGCNISCYRTNFVCWFSRYLIKTNLSKVLRPHVRVQWN